MPASSRRALLAPVLAIAIAACQAATGSPAPVASGQTPAASAPASAAPTAEPGPSVEASAPTAAGQTNTDWGRIWDALPTGFPSYPGSAKAEEAASGPASAVLVVKASTDAKTIVDWMRSKLEAATYRTEGLSGPREDGSFVLDSTGPAAGCRVQVAVAPLGGLTTVTVLYGASCPQP